MPKTFSIPDIHFPYENQEKLNLCLNALDNAKIGPKDSVIQLGDLYDQYSQNRFFRSLKMYAPQDEAEEGLLRARRFWSMVTKIVSRKARKIQLRGNHDIRAWTNLVNKCPEVEHMCDFKSPYIFDKVETVMDPNAETVINGVLYIHGWLSGGKGMPHARYFNMPVIHGHDHQAYCVTQNMKKGKLFEMSCGLLADYDSLPLTYRKTKTVHWIYAFGICETEGGNHYPHYFCL